MHSMHTAQRHSASSDMSKALQGFAGGVQSRGSEAIQQAASGPPHDDPPCSLAWKSRPESPVTVKDRTSGWP